MLTTKNANTIYNIQALRALAALLVVLFHVQLNVLPLYPNAPSFDIGRCGVDIFFVISGFVMVYLTSQRETDPLDFWRARARRILPLYWFVTLVMVALTLIGFAPVGVHDWDAGDLLASLTLFPDVRADGVAEPILTPAWTLIYEAFFYALFGLSLYLRRPIAAVAALTVLFASLAAYHLIAQPTNFALATYTNPITLEFAAGCVLGLLFVRGLFPANRAQGWSLIALGAVAMFWVWPAFARASELRGLLLVAPASMIVAGALTLERAGVRATNRVIQMQGDASYALYLLHPLLLQASFKALDKLPIAGPVALGVAGIAIAMTLASATLAHVYIERPLLLLSRAPARLRRWLAPERAQ